MWWIIIADDIFTIDNNYVEPTFKFRAKFSEINNALKWWKGRSNKLITVVKQTECKIYELKNPVAMSTCRRLYERFGVRKLQCR